MTKPFVNDPRVTISEDRSLHNCQDAVAFAIENQRAMVEVSVYDMQEVLRIALYWEADTAHRPSNRQT